MIAGFPEHVAPPLRLLVTGAEGFVGSHFVQRLLHTEPMAKVIACEFRPAVRDEAAAHARLEWVALDVRDRAACLRVMRDAKPTHVLHAAAMTDGPEAEILAVNADGTENVMQAAATCGTVQRGVLLSSSAVYGAPSTGTPCDEQHPLRLQSMYARSKRLAELLLPALERTSGVPMLAARLGPCYGPCEVAGPFRPQVSLVAKLLRAVHDQRCLCVGGEDYARDWTHLDDVSDAILALLTAPYLQHRLYNVSAGHPISARDLIHFFCERGLRVQWNELADPEQTDILLTRADARKPLVIDRLRLDTGLVPSMDWRRRMASLFEESGPARVPTSRSTDNVHYLPGRN